MKLLFFIVVLRLAHIGGEQDQSKQTLSLQPSYVDNEGRIVWRDGYDAVYTEPNPTSYNSCDRPCDGSSPMACYYQFNVEQYVNMGIACRNCSQNLSDCVQKQCVTADCYQRGLLTVNRLFMGPSIYVCKGDRIVVDVKNKMPAQTTTIHWHGIQQRGTPHMDGTPMVSQCPILETTTFRYDFKAVEYGTFFWHSHDGFQKMDGIVGALVVRSSKDPHINLYDEDLRDHCIIVTDWFHLDSNQHYPGWSSGLNRGQVPDSYLINGHGCTDSQPWCPLNVITMKRGRRYRLRLVGGTCASCGAVFSIDNHRMLLIQVDVSPVNPVYVDSITFYPGERYDVVVEANQPFDSYWMRVQGLGSCSALSQKGILKYEGIHYPYTPTTMPSSGGGVVLNPANSICNSNNTNELCINNLIAQINPSPPEASMVIGLQAGFHTYTYQELFLTDTYNHFFVPTPNPVAGMINNKSCVFGPSPLASQYNDIPQEMFCTDDNLFSSCLSVHRIPLNTVVDLVIGDSQSTNHNGLSHPFHLHGSDFYVIEQKYYNPNETIQHVVKRVKKGASLKSHPTVRKDTLAIPSGGYVVVRFTADNPGFWLLHCHFVFHAVSGMATVIFIGDFQDLPPIPSDFPKCGNSFHSNSGFGSDSNNKNNKWWEKIFQFI